VAANADVVVVGGGHNGLVAAAYLARAGLNTVVCERRGVTGGAAVSEHPFGPDYTVTSLSYVVSLLPPDLVTETLKYFDDFYKTIDNPKNAKSDIIEACGGKR